MKRILSLFPICIIIIFLNGCGSEEVNHLHYRNNMDQLRGWNDELPPNVIWNPHAHSGDYICAIDSVHPYSVTFNMPLIKISDKPLKKLKAKGWFRVTGNDNNTSLIIEIRDKAGNCIEWIAEPLSSISYSNNEWVEFQFQVNLTEKNRNYPDNSIRFYAYNPKHDGVLVDDLELLFE